MWLGPCDHVHSIHNGGTPKKYEIGLFTAYLRRIQVMDRMDMDTDPLSRSLGADMCIGLTFCHTGLTLTIYFSISPVQNSTKIRGSFGEIPKNTPYFARNWVESTE